MHQILLSGYFIEELKQRIWGGGCPRKFPQGPTHWHHHQAHGLFHSSLHESNITLGSAATCQGQWRFLRKHNPLVILRWNLCSDKGDYGRGQAPKRKEEICSKAPNLDCWGRALGLYVGCILEARERIRKQGEPHCTWRGLERRCPSRGIRKMLFCWKYSKVSVSVNVIKKKPTSLIR